MSFYCGEQRKFKGHCEVNRETFTASQNPLAPVNIGVVFKSWYEQLLFS